MRVLNNMSVSFLKDKDGKCEPQSVRLQIPPDLVRNYVNKKVNFFILVQEKSWRKNISVLPIFSSSVLIHNVLTLLSVGQYNTYTLHKGADAKRENVFWSAYHRETSSIRE